MPAVRTDAHVEVSVSTYSVVVTRDDAKAVQAYLYDHTTLDNGETPWVARGEVRKHNIFLIKTTVFTTVDHDRQCDARSSGAHIIDKLVDEANRLAVYQGERLTSGLHSTIPAVGDWHEANQVASEYL
jgi:hypothetical protein